MIVVGIVLVVCILIENSRNICEMNDCGNIKQRLNELMCVTPCLILSDFPVKLVESADSQLILFATIVILYGFNLILVDNGFVS